MKGLIFGNKEVAECNVNVQELDGRRSRESLLWQKDVVGYIEVYVCLVKENCTMSTQSSCNSLDMREEFGKDSSHLDLDLFKPMNFFNHLCQNKDKTSDSSFEEPSEQHMHDFIEKVYAKKHKLLLQKQELSLFSHNLSLRSQLLQTQKHDLANESEKIKEEKTKLQKTISQLSQDLYQLKKDKLKNKTHKKLLSINKNKISESLNKLTSQKNNIKSYIPNTSKPKTNPEYSVLILSESVLPINTSDSPILEEKTN